MNRFLVVFAVVAGLLALLIWRPSVQVNVSQVPSAPQYQTARSSEALSTSVQLKQSKALPHFLANTSLKGTEIDGLYPVDDDGNLVLSDDIKHRFEYFLSLMGEFPQEDVLQFVRDDIQLNLDEPARSQAHQLFKDYIAYKHTLVMLESQLQAPAEYEVADTQRLRAQLEQLRALRTQHLGNDVADAFFGFDDIYDEYMLSRIEIMNNRQLTEAERQQQLIGLQNQLPQGLQQMRQETERVSEAFRTASKMKQAGASDEDIFKYHSQQFGQDAAFRLDELAQQREQWQLRIQNYLAAKKAIEADETMTKHEQRAAIEALGEARFSEAERKRLAAYE